MVDETHPNWRGLLQGYVDTLKCSRDDSTASLSVQWFCATEIAKIKESYPWVVT